MIIWLVRGYWGSKLVQQLKYEILPCSRFLEIAANGAKFLEYFFSINTNSTVSNPWMLSPLLSSELKYGLPWRGITCLEVEAICNSSTETIPRPRKVLLSSSLTSLSFPPSQTSNNISDVFDVRLLWMIKVLYKQGTI